MRGLIKSIFYVCLVLLGLLIAGMIFLVVFVNPNHYKADIIDKIQKSTGRVMTIGGNIQWTFFPVLGIEVKELTLGNTPAFPETDFLSVKDADITVAFRPLLKGQIQMGKIVLNHLTLHLIKNASGQVNWHNSGPSARILSNGVRNKAMSQHDSSPFFKVALFTIGQVDLEDSSIVYEDQKQNKKIELDKLQLESKHIAYNQFFPIETSFIFKNNKISQPISVTLNANILINKNKLRLQPLDAKTNQYHWTGWLETSLSKKDPSALNGQINIAGENGAFKGIDLYYYSDLADAIIHETHPTRQDTHQTSFDSIQGTLDIQNGIVNNQDLLIRAQGIEALGQGSIDLVHDQLNYKISLQRLTNGAEIQPRGPAIPLLVTGPFSEPKIRPDWTSLAAKQIKSQIEAQIEKHKDQIPESIQKGLQSLLGN